MSSSSQDNSQARTMVRVLIVEHNEADVELSLRELRRGGLQIQAQVVATPEEFAKKIEEESFDVILADYRLPGWTGLDVLALEKKHGIENPLILVTGTLGEEVAIECIRRGVSDYVLKHQLARLPIAVQHALDEHQLRMQRIDSERSLRQSEASFHLMFAANPLPMWVFDKLTLRFLEVNDAAVEHYGYPRAEFLQMKVTAIGSDEETKRLMDILDRGHPSSTPAGLWRHRIKSGAEIEVDIRSHPIDFNTRPGVLVVAQDVTERTRAERALRESEMRFRGVFENAPYGIARATPRGRVIYANPALLRMLGYQSLSDLKRIDLLEDTFRLPTDRQEFLEEVRTKGRAEGEFEWKRPDSKFITVRLNARLARDNPEREEQLEINAEDVTESRALAKQLRQAQKFEAFGQLAGGIAHDFNNMIGAILGWADLGLDETSPEAKLHNRFEKIKQQGLRAAALTRQLLAFARRQILEPRDMDLNQSVVETLSLLEKVIGSNIEISATLAPDTAVVRADPTQVEQVIMNLCLNSRDAMPNGGKLMIDTRNAQLEQDYSRLHAQAHPGNYVLLTVTDTGAGMDSATLDRIFEPFFTTKEMGKGTGLGLATVYGIVKQHGGFACVYSELGHGTSFQVFWPVSASVVIAPPPKDELPAVKGGSEVILIAEDHEGLREIARETLDLLGYRVMLARDGEEAVQEFRRHRDEIQLVLLDVVLPKLSGPEAYAQMCLDKPGIPAVFATGYSADHTLIADMSSRGIPVLQKPYSPRDLARKVREALDALQRRPLAISG
jgi:two-component system, cell cycle sensor histidine kinase and response regulator CckA